MVYCFQTCPPSSFPYSIKLGDTIYKLASKYNTTVSSILAANPFINPNNLIVGQRIFIPYKRIYPPSLEGNYHIARREDSLYKISRTYNIQINKIIEANPDTNLTNLATGQILCIP